MLTRIQIGRLFHLYDYDIDLRNTDGSQIKFITAPNGYGKTTLLNLVHAVMNQTYRSLFNTPFGLLALTFQDSPDSEEEGIHIERELINLSEPDPNSDLPQTAACQLVFSLTHGNETIEEFTLTELPNGDIEQRGGSDNTDLFWAPRTCHYITDNRLLNVKTDSDSQTTDMGKVSLDDYVGELKQILNNPDRRREYTSRIDTFQKIINRGHFANKHIEIDPRFGFRFVAEDELKTKLSLDNLSSGEKHMVIQFFELLFRAQEGTLVMIDEPEISFHMMWQMDYLQNIKDVVASRGFQCIVATHSPQIFNGLWNKTIDLYDLSKQQPA